MTFERDYYEAPEFWADGALTNAGNAFRIQETIKTIPGDVRSLLDVGCGNGIFVNALLRTRPAIAISATDRSRTALTYVETDKFESNIDDIPKEDGSFDCVTCLQVIEHLPYDVYQKSLAELARVSRKYILIGVPFAEDLLRAFTRCPKCFSQFNVNLHLRTYRVEDLESLFDANGFRCILQRNIDRVSKWYGQDLYLRLRTSLEDLRHPKFKSPICPICGYENLDFDGEPFAGVDQAAPRKVPWAKKLLKAVWPRFDAPGYWSVALYERAG